MNYSSKTGKQSHADSEIRVHNGSDPHPGTQGGWNSPASHPCTDPTEQGPGILSLLEKNQWPHPRRTAFPEIRTSEWYHTVNQFKALVIKYIQINCRVISQSPDHKPLVWLKNSKTQNHTQRTGWGAHRAPIRSTGLCSLHRPSCSLQISKIPKPSGLTPAHVSILKGVHTLTSPSWME